MIPYFAELQPHAHLAQRGGREKPRARVPKVNLIPMRPKEGARGVDKNASFGQRMHSSSHELKSKKDRTGDVVRQTEDGGMEISWTPSASSTRDEPEQDHSGRKKGGKGKEAKRKGVEAFGAGMERGGVEEVDISEAERKGRTQRRKGIRSGSKNVFRSLAS